MSDEDTDVVDNQQLDSDVKARPPILWDVIFFNDDYTPMDFVTDVLMEIFGHDQETALLIMLDIHNQDKGVVGTYIRDVAETKAVQAAERALHEGHPLVVSVFPHEGDE